MSRIRGIGSWVKWAVGHRQIVYALVFIGVIAGIWGTFRMNKDEFPTFDIKQGLVVGIYPGATAEQVEEQLAKPLENTLFSFREVTREYTRTVCRDGICDIITDLSSPQSKKDEVWSKIKLKLQQAKQLMPPGVLAVAVLDSFSETSAMLIAIESSDKGYGEIKDYADDLSERLRDIPELAQVSILGTQDEEIAVTLDPQRLSAYGINPSSLMLGFQTSSLQTPGGTISGGGLSIPVHVEGTVASEREVAEKIVYSDPSGAVIRLKDIARVERRFKTPEHYVSYNGHNCLILSVEMRPANNIVAFGRSVDAILDKFETELPDSVTLTRVTDQPKVVGNSVFSFLRDLIISMLVVIFVMLMLFPLRSALIASSGLPVITALTIAAMYAAGIPLNTVTLAGLIVVLGMIVDDSIITMDGYMDKLGRGLHDVDAAAASARELFMPTFVATLAISLMFFPVTRILTGYMRDFVKFFPWVISISLMTSLLYAVTVVPPLEVKYIDGSRPRTSLVSRMQSRLFSFLDRIYAKLQRVSFRLPWATIGMGVILVGLGVVMFTRLNFQMVPKAARDFFVVEMYLEAGKGVEQTKAHADSLTRLFLADSRVRSVTAFVGTSAPRFAATYTPILPSPATAQLIVATGSTKMTDQMLVEYESRYEHIFPDALIRFKQMDYQAVDAPIHIVLSGADREQLMPYADDLKQQLASMDTRLKWVHTETDDFLPQVQVRLRPDEADRLGISRALLSLQIAGNLGGTPLATLWEGSTSIPVNLYTNAGGSIEDLPNMMVATGIPGVNVPLRQVADVKPSVSLAQLERRGGKPTVSVYADMKHGQSQPAAQRDIKQYIEAQGIDKAVDVSFGGLATVNKYLGPEIMWSFIAAVAILFMFLVFHFRKVSIATLTMVMSILCFFGAFFGLWLFGLDFGITSALGLISLVGIIVRNGILMYEYAEDQRFKHGADVKTAAMEAGARRMRPIFLTSLTTALGVLPMVIGGDLLWKPMGVIICFGTILSIYLIVLIMPVSYWLVFRGKGK